MRALHPVRSMSVPVVTCGILAFLAACTTLPPGPDPAGGGEPRGGPPRTPFNPNIPVECPNIESMAGDSAPATHSDSTPSVSLAGPVARIPEYHDCQRLTTGRTYGTLVGVWARHQLGSVDEEAYRRATGVPVAELYNFTTTAYPQLGIQPGYNCLYLRIPSGTRDWEARMVPQGRADICPDTISPRQWAAGHPLQVQRHIDPLDTVPEVARWDFDERSRLHYIGVRCGTAWCEVGDASGPMQSSTWYPNRPTEHIKGWYDEQWLAVANSAGQLQPGPRARLVPVPGLERLDLQAFECRTRCDKADPNGWVPVASASFTSVGAPPYVSKLNLRAGITSQIAFRFRRTLTGPQWQARIISGADTVYKRVQRVDHTGSIIPGTARWQWRENDERAWIRCAVGCCSVTETDL